MGLEHLSVVGARLGLVDDFVEPFHLGAGKSFERASITFFHNTGYVSAMTMTGMSMTMMMPITFSYLPYNSTFAKITNLAYFVKLLVDYYENFTAPYNLFFLFNEYLTFNPWWHPSRFMHCRRMLSRRP